MILTSDVLNHTIQSSHPNHRDISFPQHALVAPLRGAQLSTFMNIWNIAADDKERGASNLARARLQSTHHLLRQHASSDDSLFHEIIERAIAESNTSYSTSLEALSAADIIEYVSNEMSQSSSGNPEPQLLSDSLRRQAVSVLCACLPNFAVREDARLVPLADDFSQIAITHKY